MPSLSEQLLSLALTPVWQPSVESDIAELLAELRETEESLLKSKIICFVITPEEPSVPAPETPDEQEPDPEEANDELLFNAVG